MPCNLNTICYIDQHSETLGKANFVVTAVGVISSRHQNTNIFIHIVAFYPKDMTRDCDLERFNKGDVIRVQGRFSIVETEVDKSKVKLIKIVASDICVLNLDEEDLPRSSLSVVLVGTASDNSEINDDKVTLNLNAREYIDNQNNKSLSFDLYHFPEDNHLLPITSKVSRGLSLYITGHLSLIGDLLLVRLTQINFIENLRTSPYKSSNFAWEKRQVDDTSVQSTPSASVIAKSLVEKPNKKRVRKQTTPFPHSLKIPKLSSLALPQSTEVDEHQDEASLLLSQSNIDNDEIQSEISYNEDEQESEIQEIPKSRRGRKKK